MFIVVGGGRDCSGNMSSMVVIIHRIIIIISKIPAVHIIDKAISIIVFAITRNLSGVFPHIALQIRMFIIDSSVDDGYNHAWRTFGDLPRFGCLNFRHCPLVFPVWIIGSCTVTNYVVWFGIFNRLIFFEFLG